MKVAQFSGYVSAEANYHHGEASLNGAIVKMAQDYVGSNNINLLTPDGNFGSRGLGGRDSASERYIFTRLHDLTHKLFHKSDTPLLKQVMDDGDLVEPEYYVPILPMILVNGTTGIGTGYSTDVPMHNPLEIMENLMALMEGRDTKRMKPWYRGFTGAIEEKSEKQYINRGVVKIVDDTTVEITELPIETWTSDYKIYLEALIVGSTSSPSPKAAKAEAAGKGEAKAKKSVKQVIQSFKEYHTDSTVRFELKMKKEDVSYYKEHMDELEEYLKLSGKINYSNMTLYDPQGHLKKYESTDDILKEFYMVRLTFYMKRKAYMLKYLKRLLDICAAKVRFIEEIMDKTLDIMYKDDAVVEKMLEERNYPRFGIEKEDLELGAENHDKSYDYLLHMQIRTFTKSKLDALRKDHQEKEGEHRALEEKSEITLWKDDLSEFKVEYEKMMAEYEERYQEEREKKVAGTAGKTVRKRVVKK
jgi:DNA topoisomerase-2